MIKRQYNQSKQTLELWKRHLTNSLFQESKSSLHTQDFHQVQQEPQQVQHQYLTGMNTAGQKGLQFHINIYICQCVLNAHGHQKQSS